MKFCTLRVKNQGAFPLFEVLVESVISNESNKRIDSTVVDKFQSFQVSEITEFISKYDVGAVEIEEALIVMEDQGHNVANFGYYGSFMYSAYEGVLI